ncbi:MAG: SagB/ThcOx family dehydrogenase [Clostridiaceae bacterium]|nr:SagB/ThcOx family dehydrogenase [Clostridiaceae bacterium]
MNKDKIVEMREYLTANTWMNIDFSQSDQGKKVDMPPVQKAVREDQELIILPEVNPEVVQTSDYFDLVKNRESRRKYTDQALTMEELSFLLWATQGVRKQAGKHVFRVVPSGGNRHTFETYLAINRVESLAKGIYRYLPLEHALVLETEYSDEAELKEKMKAAANTYAFFADAAVGFIWTTIPYRMEWRYMECTAKMIAIDAGHVCQNLYLAAEAIGCGTCAMGAYNQAKADELLNVDGKDEFVVYMAPVGKV